MKQYEPAVLRMIVQSYEKYQNSVWDSREQIINGENATAEKIKMDFADNVINILHACKDFY